MPVFARTCTPTRSSCRWSSTWRGEPTAGCKSVRRRRSILWPRRFARRFIAYDSRRNWTANRMATENTAWQLEDFVDSLVVELDKTRETLAVKAINKPLTYTVKELALDLNIFPSYDGDQVRFVTAQPGEQGASKVSIQLGSITDQQVRATSKVPGARTDVEIADLPVDKTTRRKLRKLGATSVDDLKAIEQKN